MNRDERGAWLAEQEQTRQKQREEQGAGLRRETASLWTAFAHEAKVTGELNISWKQSHSFFAWEKVLALGDLVALRITSFDLRELPETLPLALPLLESLSLINDSLERLPEDIGALKYLIELDLTKNRLRKVPESFPKLNKLKMLNLSCNALVALPEEFGNLDKLEQLWLEGNALTQLPASISGCQSARCANFSRNKLTELPATIGELSSLTKLSVNLNALVELPETIVKLSNLRLLHASRNQLTKLPRSIGVMQTLRELRLDWNSIQELPFSFRALRNLQVLSMEQNPMRLPPNDIIARGIPQTLSYMEKALGEFQRSSRREVVEALLNVLTFAARLIDALDTKQDDRALGASNDAKDANASSDLEIILALFEPNCDRLSPPSCRDLKLYGVVWESFYSDLLPAIERQQVLAYHRQQGDSKLLNPSTALLPISQRFTSEEIEDALMNYRDDLSPASVAGGRDQPAVPIEFRRCACFDPTALRERGQRVRKVCLPRTTLYQCQRPGRLLRAQMLTKEQVQDQLASTYLRARVTRLVEKTRHKAFEYINSSAGTVHFERTARMLAQQTVQHRLRLGKLYQRHDKSCQRIETQRSKLRRKIDALQRAKDARLKPTQDKCARLENDRRVLIQEREAALLKDKESAYAVVKANKVVEVDKKLEALRVKLREIETEGGGLANGKIGKAKIAIEGLDMAERKLVTAMERAWTDELETAIEDEGEETNDGEHSSDETDGDSDQSDEDSDVEQESEESDEEDEVAETEALETMKASSPAPSFLGIDMPDLVVEDYRKAAVKGVQEKLEKQAIDAMRSDPKTRISRMSAVLTTPHFIKPLIVPYEQLVVLFQAQVRESYVEMQCLTVSQQTTREFLQMRAILQRWRGLSTRAVFEAWHQMARARHLDADRVKVRAERKKALDKQNREHEAQLARMEAQLWTQRVDRYTDAIYYENEKTGATRREPPQYWDEQQQQLRARINDVPRVKLPPI